MGADVQWVCAGLLQRRGAFFEEFKQELEEGLGGDYAWVDGFGASHFTGLINACEASAATDVVSIAGTLGP